jgi:hypothetical protein
MPRGRRTDRTARYEFFRSRESESSLGGICPGRSEAGRCSRVATGCWRWMVEVRCSQIAAAHAYPASSSRVRCSIAEDSWDIMVPAKAPAAPPMSAPAIAPAGPADAPTMAPARAPVAPPSAS